MPAFGTCAGMILLAAEVLDGRPDQRSFGAIDVSVRRNAFGRQVDSFETALAVDGLAGGAVPGRVHPGAGRRAGGRGRRGAGARVDGRPVLCRQGAVLVAAFHPELSGDLRLHQLFLSQT